MIGTDLRDTAKPLLRARVRASALAVVHPTFIRSTLRRIAAHTQSPCLLPAERGRIRRWNRFGPTFVHPEWPVPPAVRNPESDTGQAQPTDRKGQRMAILGGGSGRWARAAMTCGAALLCAALFTGQAVAAPVPAPPQIAFSVTEVQTRL